jgi:uncharacterized membrane protein YgcG
MVPGFVLVVALAWAGHVAAVAPEVKDDGKFFSAEAIKKANVELRAIARLYERDLLIETFASVPADQAEKVKAMSREERVKFFHQWATDRAETAVVNGIYVLICKEPSYIQVEVTQKARSVFDNKARNKLRDVLVDEFRDLHYDQGLLSAVRFVRDRLAAASIK